MIATKLKMIDDIIDAYQTALTGFKAMTEVPVGSGVAALRDGGIKSTVEAIERMALRKQEIAASLLPVGTRIVFNQTIEIGPDDHQPLTVIARKGDSGEVTGHNSKEGFMVQTDIHKQPFGARPTEFTAVAC